MAVLLNQENNSSNQYNIDWRKVNVKDVDGSMQYLSSLNIPEDKLSQIKSTLDYEHAKVLDDINNYNQVVKDRPDIETAFKLKNSLDTGEELTDNFEFGNTKYERQASKFVNRQKNALNNLFKNQSDLTVDLYRNLTDYESEYFRSIGADIDTGNGLGSKTSITLPYRNRGNIKMFLDNFKNEDKLKYSNTKYTDNGKVTLQDFGDNNNVQFSGGIAAQGLGNFIPAPNLARDVKQFYKNYQELDNYINRTSDPTDNDFNTNLISTGIDYQGITPRHNQLLGMLPYANDKQRKNIEAEIQGYLDIFNDAIRNPSLFVNMDVWELDSEKQVYNKMDQKDRLVLNSQLSHKLSTPTNAENKSSGVSSVFTQYIKDNNINSLHWSSYYDTQQGKLMPKLTISDSNGNLKSYIIDWKNNEELNRYNASSEVRAIHDVDKLTGNNNSLNVLLHKNSKNTDAYQIKNIGYDQYVINNGNSDIAILNKEEAVSLREFYNAYIFETQSNRFNNLSEENKIAKIKEFGKEYQKVMENIFGNLNIFGVPENYKGAKTDEDIYSEIVANIMGMSIYPFKN